MQAKAFVDEPDMVGDRLAVARQHELDLHVAGGAQGLQIALERVRPRCAGRVGRGVAVIQRTRDERIRGDVLDQVVPSQEDRPLRIEEQGVRGAMAGPVEDPQCAVAERELAAVAHRPADVDAGPPGAEAGGHRLQRGHQVLGYAMTQHQPRREFVVALHVLAVAGQHRGQPVQRRDLGARAPGKDAGQADVVHVLVSDDQQPQLVDRVAAVDHRALELVEGLPRVRPAVDQGERIVLDQVGVDAPDHERGGDGQAVDPGLRRPLQRLGGSGARIDRFGTRIGGPRAGIGGPRAGIGADAVGIAGAHDRIKARTSSRRRSMSSRDTSDSRHSRSSGSVFEGRTLKCQSS